MTYVNTRLITVHGAFSLTSSSYTCFRTTSLKLCSITDDPVWLCPIMRTFWVSDVMSPGARVDRRALRPWKGLTISELCLPKPRSNGGALLVGATRAAILCSTCANLVLTLCGQKQMNRKELWCQRQRCSHAAGECAELILKSKKKSWRPIQRGRSPIKLPTPIKILPRKVNFFFTKRSSPPHKWSRFPPICKNLQKAYNIFLKY